jgi:hypothetical protein
MSLVTKTIHAYLAMWNERDGTRRARLVEEAWSTDGQYLDPQFDAVGHAAMSCMVATAQERFPDHSLRLTSGLDRHHNEVRFGWEVVATNGSPALTGVDFGSLGADGRLTRVVGFFGDLPAVEIP